MLGLSGLLPFSSIKPFYKGDLSDASREFPTTLELFFISGHARGGLGFALTGAAKSFLPVAESSFALRTGEAVPSLLDRLLDLFFGEFLLTWDALLLMFLAAFFALPFYEALFGFWTPFVFLQAKQK